MPLLNERVLHRVRDEQMRICAAPEIALEAVPVSTHAGHDINDARFREFNEEMLLAEAQGEDAVAGVVPVDDELGAADEGDGLDNGERGDAGRILSTLSAWDTAAGAHALGR